jgi:hypothetical protein
MQRGRCQLCGTVSPSFVRLTRRAPEGGRRNPRRWDKYFFHVYIGLHRDVRPAGTVFSVAISPVRRSPPLQRHSGHCSERHPRHYEGARGQDIATPATVPRTASRQRHPRGAGRPWASTRCWRPWPDAQRRRRCHGRLSCPTSVERSTCMHKPCSRNRSGEVTVVKEKVQG